MKDQVKKNLLSNHPSKAFGRWVIYGEDPNADFGSYHHEPYLATVLGTYSNVVEYALQLKNFFTWGRGGRIEQAALDSDLKNVDELLPGIKDLKEEHTRLKKQLQDVEDKLGPLK